VRPSPGSGHRGDLIPEFTRILRTGLLSSDGGVGATFRKLRQTDAYERLVNAVLVSRDSHYGDLGAALAHHAAIRRTQRLLYR